MDGCNLAQSTAPEARGNESSSVAVADVPCIAQHSTEQHSTAQHISPTCMKISPVPFHSEIGEFLFMAQIGYRIANLLGGVPDIAPGTSEPPGAVW